MHEVIHHKVAIIHRSIYDAKIYQANLFENFLKGTYSKARMKRGTDRGNLKDSWEFDNSGNLLSYTTYNCFVITNIYDSHKLAGEGYTKFIFINGNWDDKTLNHMFKHLVNLEGVSNYLDKKLLEEPFGVRYHTNFQS